MSILAPDISLTHIAREAGVSRTTVYRNFLDKASLIMAIFHYNLDLLEKYANRIKKDDEECFMTLLASTVNLQVRFHALIPYLPDDKTLTNRLTAIFSEPVTKAMEAGELRPDFKINEDLTLLITMLGSSMLYTPQKEKRSRIKRAFKLVMEGIKPAFL